jgi:hypothetical protein
LWLIFGHLLGKVAQGIEFGTNGLHCGELRVLGTLVGDELPAHLHSASARIQALGAKLRIGLTLAIDDGGAILKEVGQVVFGSLAPAS